MAEIRHIFPFHYLILSIDLEKDKDRTLPTLAKLQPTFPVVPLMISGPENVKNWTRCLNGPLAYLYKCGVRQGKVFNVSYETKVDLPSFQDSYSFLTLMPMKGVSVRRTPKQYLTEPESWFLNTADPKAIQNLLGKVVRYIRDGVDASGDWKKRLKFLFRNTGMLWDFQSLISLNGYDPQTTQTGGQEELAALCGLLQKYDYDLSRVINPHLTYWIDDPRLNTEDEQKIQEQKKKMCDEDASVEAILERYRNTQQITQPDFLFV